jgi:hypothetical protein
MKIGTTRVSSTSAWPRARDGTAGAAANGRSQHRLHPHLVRLGERPAAPQQPDQVVEGRLPRVEVGDLDPDRVDPRVAWLAAFRSAEDVAAATESGYDAVPTGEYGTVSVVPSANVQVVEPERVYVSAAWVALPKVVMLPLVSSGCPLAFVQKIWTCEMLARFAGAETSCSTF